MSTRARLTIASLVAFAGCETQQEDPPLFNAKDLSVQCPTGQVGWDFSTGGNDTSLVENSVSREITVDRAMLGSCNYQADFAVDCDGKRDCTRPVKKSTSPTCAGGGLDLAYHCGSETFSYNVIIPADASSQNITLACPEPMTITSAIYASNAPSKINQSDITTAIASKCTGRRRCALADPYVINNSADPWPNNHKETKIKYFCGTDPVLKEATVASGARVDLMCPLFEAPAATFTDTLRIQSVAFSPELCAAVPSKCSDGAATQRLKEWDARLRTSCEGKKQCRLTMDKYVPGAQGNFQQDTQLVVNYWCTSPQAPEQRSFRTLSIYESSFDLWCGTPITIVGVDGNGADLDGAKTACDTKSRCTLPQFKPVTPLPTGNNTRATQATYRYTCGDNVLDVRASRAFSGSTFSNGNVTKFDPIERTISCDRANNNLVGGIRIVSANVNGADALVSATSQCYGRDVCKIFTNSNAGGLSYRCGSSYELKNATYNGILPAGWELSCKPDVKVVSLECENAGDPNEKRCVGGLQEYGPSGNYGYRYSDATPASRCAPGNNGVCNFTKRLNQVAHLKWTCGQDPKVYSYDGVGEPYPLDNPVYNFLQPRCEVPEKPYVEKACVPVSCAGNQRRDSKLKCIPDSTKLLTDVYTAPILKEWAAGADGGTSQWGGADTTVLKEDYPYQLFGYSQYKAWGGAQQPPNTAITLWAYDEFTANTGSGVPTNQQTTFGFRCVLSEAPIADAEYPSITAGYRRVINGGKGGVLPLSCYRQNVDDGRNAWSDGARRVGIPESQFRAKYTRKTSWVVGAFDATGKYTARAVNNQLVNAVNPIGFFYNNQNGWIDQLSFYAQSTDFRFATQVSFVESNEIQLDAMSAALRQADIFIDVSKDQLLPTFDVDFTWSQRGDSPARNPLSPRSILSANAANPLNKRNLRATIELARLSTTEPEWVAVNATSFPARGLSGGNATSQTVRLSADVTPALRQRMLSIKGTSGIQTSDGFMRDFTEDNTAFRVRVCMDFDEVTHALGSSPALPANLDNKGVTAQREGVTYGVKIARRCAETAPLLLKRELFVYPTTPVATVERSNDSAASPRQGDGTAGSNSDTGNQNGCTESGGKQICNGQSRSGLTTSGQFALSAIDSQSNDKMEQTDAVKTTSMSTNMTLFGFKVFDLSGGAGAEPQSSGAWQIDINLTPNLDNIADLWKRRRTAAVKTSADKVKTKPKAKKGLLSKFERDGLAVKLGKEFPFTLGPFPFVLEVSFSVGFGFGAGLHLAGDYQSTSNMTNPKYPCLKSGSGDCFVAYTEAAKNYEEALSDCRFKGGTLAEVRSAGDLAQVTSAISAADPTTATNFWLGGQLAYQYQDPRCDTTRASACAGTSRTRYAWLTGNVPFANQTAQAPTLNDPNSLLGNHGFGGNLGSLVTRVPVEASVLFNKSTNRLETAVTTSTAPYVCQFDPANSYIEASIGVSANLEFTMGFGAKICTPSADIGFCLGVTLNLITAGVEVSATRSRILVFNNSGIKVSLLGNSVIEGTWEVAFMSGAFEAELNFLFWSTSWEIASYGGLYKLEGDLFPAIESPYARTYP